MEVLYEYGTGNQEKNHTIEYQRHITAGDDNLKLNHAKTQ